MSKMQPQVITLTLTVEIRFVKLLLITSQM